MGLIIDLSGEPRKTEAEKASYPVSIKAQEPALKQDPPSLTPPSEPGPKGAELISRNLQYLAGITADLTGWTLWKRIEQCREHRFALDAAGVVRWEQWYALKLRLTLAAGTDQGHETELNCNE